MRAAFAAVLCLPLIFTGCTLSPTTTDTSPSAGLAIQGEVHGGYSPIVGSQIYLLAASTGPSGTASTSLMTNVPGSTTLDTSTGPTHGFYYVTSDSKGKFSITGDYSCTTNTQVYLYAVGGNPGVLPPTTDNTYAGLMAVLGNCPSPGGTSAFLGTIPHVVVNEVSTTAAAYAFSGFATDALHVSSSGSALALTGIQNAFANAANLANLGTGAALAIPPSDPNGTAPQATLYSLANILASCVSSPGDFTGGASPSYCYTLMTTALSGGTTGTQPTDTASAAINIAHNPAANVPALWGLIGGQQPFNGLSTQPNDFTLGLQFISGGINAPNAIAIDGSGNVWVTNSGSSPNTVTKLAASGAAASGSPYDVGGMDGLVGIAIDLTGNAWLANDLTASTGSVIELSSSGTLVSPSPFTTGVGTPAGIAIDGSGDVWITNSYNNNVVELTSSGTAHSGSPYSVGGLNLGTNAAIAIDSTGAAWIANTGTATKLTSTGAAATGSPFTNGLDSPVGVAIDHSNNAWMPNASSNTLAELASSGTPATGSPFSGGLSNPGGVAVDGSGNVWVANYEGSSVAEFSNAGTPLSGDNGVGSSDGSVIEPDAVAIDPSGNVWIGNAGGNGAAVNGSITELVGAATPVVTPLAVGVKNGTLGTQP